LTEKLTYENAELRGLNKKLLRRGGFAVDAVIDDLKKTLKASPPFSVKVEKIPAIKRDTQHSEIAALILSDWHISEVIDEKETNGINKYNSIIAANRVNQVVQSVKSIINFHTQAYKIEKLWIPILGDTVSGDHVIDLQMTNDLDSTAATILASRLFILAIIELKELGIPIEITCIAGNHGRLSTKLPTKRMAYDTLDYIVFEILALYFEKDPQVKITIHPGYMVSVKQFGHKYILMHGVDRSPNKLHELENVVTSMFDSQQYRDAFGETKQSYDYILAGHLHQTHIKSKLIVNSCLGGFSELGVAWKLPPLIDAFQTIFGISSKHPKTWLYTLEVADIRSEKAENNFSIYAKDFMDKHGR
jgi:predicted phosphodiesterase